MKTNLNMKNLIALALAGSAASAFAQSSVTLFGVVDLALTRGTATGAGSSSVTQMSTGGNTTSRLGFRGVEDLGGGMSASFWLESQLYTDSGLAGREVPAGNQSITTPRGSGLMFTRRSTISLSGGWGELRIGRDFTPSQWGVTVYDPFFNNGVGGSMLAYAPGGGLGAGTGFALVPAGQGASGPITRASNQFSYFLPPKLGGVFGQVSYWLGENSQNGAANESDGTGYGGRLGYGSGPFEVAAGYSKTRYRATPVATTAGAPSGDLESWNVGGSWNTGPIKLMAIYGADTRQSAARAEGRGYLVGATVPIGSHELRASYSQYEIDAGTGAVPRTRLLALGYVHNFSKRTAVYATAARAMNSSGARFALGGAAIGAGIGDARSTGLDFGVRHSF